MFPCSGFGYGYWWVFPLIMISMMALCFFMMRKHRGPMMCGPDGRGKDTRGRENPKSGRDTPGQRSGRGGIGKDERQDKIKIITRRAGGSLFALLLVFVSCYSAFPGEIPPLAEKKTVILDKSHAEAEYGFSHVCGKCHTLPELSKIASPKPDCTRNISEADQARAKSYVTDVVKGKSLYESRCGRCHKLIAPGAHTRDYWSKNLCVSGECFIQNLTPEEEQQVLLYLNYEAKRD